MVLNNNNFLSDGDFFADEEEWEFLNNDDSTSKDISWENFSTDSDSGGEFSA